MWKWFKSKARLVKENSLLRLEVDHLKIIINNYESRLLSSQFCHEADGMKAKQVRDSITERPDFYGHNAP